MKTEFVNWFKVLGIGCAMSLLAACNDPNEPMGKGDVEFEITDAPTDDASIKGVMVTVAEVKVDGHSVSGFSKQTIDLKAYQEGNTKLLASAQQLDAKSYSNLTLVLDLNTDANGNAPGCYVLTHDNIKYKLKSTTSGTTDVNITKSWSVASNTKTNVVMDFDLRKAIAYSDDASVRYSFVNDNSLNAAIRVVTKSKAGTIKGSYQEDQNSNADKVIVYAYKKSTFNASTETQGQGSEKVFFANAVASAEVKSGLTGNSYTLALLEEGEYEIYFAAHTENAQSGRMTFQAMLESETTANGSVGNLIKVQGGATINISTTIKGII